MQKQLLKMNYEKLKDILREIYHGKDELFTPKVVNQLNLIIWKAEQYDKKMNNITYCVSCDKKTEVKVASLINGQTETECIECGLTQTWGTPI